MNILSVVFLISLSLVLLAIVVDVSCQIWAEKHTNHQPKPKMPSRPKKPIGGRHRLHAAR